MKEKSRKKKWRYKIGQLLDTIEGICVWDKAGRLSTKVIPKADTNNSKDVGEKSKARQGKARHIIISC